MRSASNSSAAETMALAGGPSITECDRRTDPRYRSVSPDKLVRSRLSSAAHVFVVFRGWTEAFVWLANICRVDQHHFGIGMAGEVDGPLEGNLGALRQIGSHHDLVNFHPALHILERQPWSGRRADTLPLKEVSNVDIHGLCCPSC